MKLIPSVFFLAILLLSAAPPLCAQPAPDAPAAITMRAMLLYLPSSTDDLSSKVPATDTWLGFDKVQHATISSLWTLSTQYALVNKIKLSEGNALPLSVTSAAIVGISKELYDEYVTPGNRLSHRDLVADAAGIAVAVVLILL